MHIKKSQWVNFSALQFSPGAIKSIRVAKQLVTPSTRSCGDELFYLGKSQQTLALSEWLDGIKQRGKDSGNISSLFYVHSHF